MKRTSLFLTALLFATSSDGADYERTRPKDVEPNKEQLAYAIKMENEHVNPKDIAPAKKKPMTEREKKRAAYLAEKAAKRKAAGRAPAKTAKPTKKPKKNPLSHTGFDTPNYGDVCYKSLAYIQQILSPDAVLARCDSYGPSGIDIKGRVTRPVLIKKKLMIIEGLDTTNAKYNDSKRIWGVFAMVNQARYVTAAGTSNTVPIYRFIMQVKPAPRR